MSQVAVMGSLHSYAEGVFFKQKVNGVLYSTRVLCYLFGCL